MDNKKEEIKMEMDNKKIELKKMVVTLNECSPERWDIEFVGSEVYYTVVTDGKVTGKGSYSIDGAMGIIALKLNRIFERLEARKKLTWGKYVPKHNF